MGLSRFFLDFWQNTNNFVYYGLYVKVFAPERDECSTWIEISEPPKFINARYILSRCNI